MKKVLFILILFQAFTFIYANEDASTDKNYYSEIRKEYGLGYYKGDQYLKTKNDFIKALSPIPKARDLYILSQKWKTSSLVLLGTTIGTFISSGVLATMAYIYIDLDSFMAVIGLPYVLGLSFGFTALSLFVLLTPQVIVMIVSFAKAYKKKKEAIILYNNMVKEFKEKTGVIFNMSPFAQMDKEKNFYTGIVFSLRFN